MRTSASYRAQPIAAGASFTAGGRSIYGFLCTVSGTLSVTDADGTVLVDALPVTQGEFTEIPLAFNTGAGGTVALTTAAGTLFV